jgi:uncharacterized cupin superfamily protein
MKERTTCIFLFLSILSISAYAGDTPQAISLSAADLSGDILKGQPVTQFFGNDTQFVDVFTSDDKKFSIGMFGMVVEEEANGTTRYENFPIYEFMYFLEGSMKLIDDNGKVTEAGPGEVLFIPKGWTGTRITDDIRKISVVYKENPESEEK